VAAGDRLEPGSPPAPSGDRIAAAPVAQIEAARQGIVEPGLIDRGGAGFQQRAGKPLGIGQRRGGQTGGGHVGVGVGAGELGAQVVAVGLGAVLQVAGVWATGRIGADVDGPLRVAPQRGRVAVLEQERGRAGDQVIAQPQGAHTGEQ